MLKTRLAAMGLAAALIAGPAAAGVIEDGRLPDGTYECSMYNGSSSQLFGNIAIRGLTFQGPAYDNNFQGGPYRYQLSGKVVLWGGPMMGLTEGGNRVAATVITNNDPATAAFDITVMSSADNAYTINCSRAG
jgi:hypothetical protein